MNNVEEISVNDEQVADVQEDIGREQEVENESEQESNVEKSDISEEKAEVAEPKKDFKTEDNAKYAAARRESEKQVKLLREKQDNFAKQYGYESFDAMETAQRQQKYIDDGVSPELAQKIAQQDKTLADMQEQINRSKIAEQKLKLQNQKYFKDLEPEIDAIVEVNPNLSVEFVFNYMRGQKMDELIAKESKAAAQRQLNNINGKSHMKTESTGSLDVSNIHIDEEEFRIAKKLNPKETRESYLKFLKSQRS